MITGYITSTRVSWGFGWKTFKKNLPNDFVLGLSQTTLYSEDDKFRVDHFVIGFYFVAISVIFEKEN